jgi:hypothetical protein
MADGVAITAGSGTTILTDDTGAGGHAQINKLAISTDGSGTLIPADATVGLLVNPNNLLADDAAFTPGTSKVMPVGFEADETATDSVDEGDAGAARMTLDRKQIVTLQPHTTGGSTVYHLISAGTTNATVVKASAGQLYGYYIYNANASARKIAFHDTASAPTAGASVYMSFVLPAASAANVAFPNGVTFATGIAFTTVTEVADAGTTAVASGDLAINLFYK